jgi:crotonobetainyl-CoA:carnitine CoA-transferase CaiB-like acyl-CoA transferase
MTTGQADHEPDAPAPSRAEACERMSTTAGGGALSGVRVLDFSQVIFGPSCTAMLADHGAEVIKVERPGQGDLTRTFGPFLDGESLPYAGLNRNKASLAVDLKAPEGREVIYRLVDHMDVVVSNFRPGVMESLGLGDTDLRGRNPRLVYAVGSGYGQSGPYAGRGKAGHETMAQALGGIAHANAERDGTPHVAPVPIADVSGGNLLVQGILLALLARGRTGHGQRVEVALLDGVMWMQGWFVARPVDGGKAASSTSARDPLSGCVYRTLDGYVVLTHVFRPHPLREICAALGIDDLSHDSRFASPGVRAEHAEALRGVLQARLRERTTAEWVEILEGADIMCAPVQALEDAMADPQVRHNEMVVEVEHASHGRIEIVGVPVKLSETPGRVRTAAPRIGQDTSRILRRYGYSEAEVAELCRRRVVAGGEPLPTGTE